MDHSFGSAEEDDHVRMMQSCNGLLLTGVFRMTFDPRKSLYYKVVQVGRTSDIPHGLHRGRNFLESFGGPSNDPILLLMEIPHMLHLEWKFFESNGSLLLVCRDDIGSTKFTICEMTNGYPYGRLEGEEDAFVGINLSEKVVKYNLILKTNNEIFDIGSNQMDDDDEVEFIPPFKVDPNLYEFIPSLASV
ncbi:hypothetical protein Tco_0842691 [Tanacetum coccineum]|uniref:Uncharacterized protein n=1 Tax=Tanacetum coccineum TaxID=301880 RepID=A0ABQ5B5N3_9ASTR